MSTSPPNPAWNQDTKRIVAVIGLIIFVLLLYISRSVLPFLIWAAILAYIFQPLVGAVERLRLPRGAGALLSVLLLILVVALGPLILIPIIANQIASIKIDLPQITNWLLVSGQSMLARYPIIEIADHSIDTVSLVGEVNAYLVDALAKLELPSVAEVINYLITGLQTASGLLGTATDLASNVLAAIFATGLAAILLLMYTFYLTKDGLRLRPWLSGVVPEAHWPQIQQLIQRINLVWAAFFRGQIILSLTIAIITTVALTLIGMPGPLILGILAGLLEVVPNLGPLLAMIPAVVLALIQGSQVWPDMSNWIFALLTLGVYVVIQQLENVLLVPRIMGHNLSLHPMLVLIGIAVGASTVGILGAFLAAPVLATLRLVAIYAHAKLLDWDPFPDPLPVGPIRALGPLGRLAKRMAAGRAVQKPKPSAEDPS